MLRPRLLLFTRRISVLMSVAVLSLLAGLAVIRASSAGPAA